MEVINVLTPLAEAIECETPFCHKHAKYKLTFELKNPPPLEKGQYGYISGSMLVCGKHKNPNVIIDDETGKGHAEWEEKVDPMKKKTRLQQHND